MTGPGATEGSGVDTDLATLRSALGRPAIQAYVEALARVEAELSRLREALDNGDRLLSQAGRALEAAEARCAQLEAEALAFDNVRAGGRADGRSEGETCASSQRARLGVPAGPETSAPAPAVSPREARDA